MTRIATFAQSQTLLQGILENQNRVFEAQRQVTTGKKSSEIRGLATQTSALVGAKSLKSRTEDYLRTGDQVNARLEMMDTQIGGILEAARSLRHSILNTLGQESAAGFTGLVEGAYSQIVSGLNSQVSGSYLFAGSRVDVPPVNADTLAGLVALPLASDAFDNDQLKAQARLTDNFDLNYGILADEMAGDLLASVKRIGEFIAGPSGPIDGKLTAAQIAFLNSELPLLDAAVQKVLDNQILNGLNANKLEDAMALQNEQSLSLETFIGDIEDVDITEAITRLNNDRTALEASYRVVGSISQLSLVQFI